MPSDIRFASFKANRISLKPQGFNITVAVRQYHSLRQQRISLMESRKERALRNFVSALLSLLFLLPVSHLYDKRIGLCPYPYSIFPIRTTAFMGVSYFYQKGHVADFRKITHSY